MRLWWFLSPGPVQPGRRSTSCGIFQEHPTLRTIVGANPFAILFEAYRKVIYGTRDAQAAAGPARTSPRWPCCSSRASIFLALTTIVFKRLEPNFAKVI